MPKQPKAKPQAQRAALGLLPAATMLGPTMLGLPAQIRLAAREQQRPPAFVPPKKRRGR
jgi:hypothetical protein